MYEEIDRLFRMELNDRRLSSVIPVSLQLSPDLRNAKVLYGLRPGANGAEPPAGHDRQVQEGLEKATPFLRARVAEALSMKRTPDLHFHRDRTAEATLRAARLLTEERMAQARSAGAPGPGDRDDADVAEPPSAGGEAAALSASAGK